MRRCYQVHAREKTLELGRRTCLMGIINATPDSFYPGSRTAGVPEAVDRAGIMVNSGAEIVDIGGESTRPGSAPVSAAEEIDRVLPLLEAIRRASEVVLSVDTHRSAVARAALQAGADMVNDISGFHWDGEMAATVAEFGAAAVVMHAPGNREDLHRRITEGDVLESVAGFLQGSLATAEEAGVPRDRIIVDPGLGFGKTLEHNLKILGNLDFFQRLDRPVLVGPSRKSFIGKVLSQEADGLFLGTAAVAACAVLAGAHIVRVHDVAPMRSIVNMADAIAGTRNA